MKATALRSSKLTAPPRVASFAKFMIVGLTGIVVNEIVYVGLVEQMAVWFVLAAILSTQASTTWNFLGNEMWAFSGRRFAGSMWLRYLAYAAMNNALLLLRVPMLWAFGMAGLTPAWSNLIALGVLFVLRFAVSDGFVWRRKGQGTALDDTGAPLQTYRYDIAGLIRLDSDSELPELAYFRSEASTPPDIRIRMRRVGAFPTPRVRLRREGNRVTYREHLGILGADFNLTLGQPIEIEASPLLALSRHVLYTNVVEALLRFVLVSKGYVLLHSAGMEVDGKASLLSAQTDTGKTSTVINLVRDRGWGFISDDMTIVDPAGRVRTFPKPMTLSYHTMVRAVDVNTLSMRKRMALQVQSRIHSKSGRSVGKGLGSLNVPIMSINSVVQLVVPPPKYHITKLLSARIAPEAKIEQIFLMERGEPVQERVSLDAAVDQLIDNTDDAYGFPPFATLAPHLVIGGADYPALRARERELLTQALRNATIWRLRVRGHEWGELLPRLILGDEAASTSAEREPVGIPIQPEEREPVGIPIQPEDVPAFGFDGSLLGAAVRGDTERQIYTMESSPGPAPSGHLLAESRALPPEQPRPFRLERRPGRGGTTQSSNRPPEAVDRSKAGGMVRTGFSGATDAALALGAFGPFGLTRGDSAVEPGESIAERAMAEVRAHLATWVAMAGIVAVAAVVRLWAITAVGFNNDEAVYAGQGAALAGDPINSGLFAIFRAHPLLTQFLYSIPFRFVGVNDVTPRLIAVAFGLATVGLGYAAGSLLYNRRVGLIAAAILAVMPYEVVVTRQALLDGPESTLFLLAIYLLARYSHTLAPRWLYAAAFAAGLAVLAKETAVLLIPVAVAFLLLTPEIHVPLRRIAVALGIFVLAFSPYPAAIILGNGTGAAQSFLLWQILRQPNHTWTFYGEVLPTAMGPLVVLAAAIGLVLAVRLGRWQERLIIAWLGVPIAFFELWPVKGFQYLLPIAPAVAILAALTLERLVRWTLGRVALVRARTGETLSRGSWARQRLAAATGALLLAATLGSIVVPTALAVGNTNMAGSLAGTGGLPGGREAGGWIKENVPQGAVFLTEGPTLANIIEFYGQRRAFALSVSPNPLKRNPAYDQIGNPDRALQLNAVQYVATDIWSAQRSPYFDSLLRRYVRRYHGSLVYQQTARVSDLNGNVSERVVIQIFEVRP